MVPYGLTTFTGAFLLFLVQPLIGKYILPWFGGSPAVWTTCMLFFQVLLLCGYAYAHLISRFLKLRTQVVLHLALIALAFASLPITPSESWRPAGAENPTWRIVALLTFSLGLPYLVLSATSPLLQHWWVCTNPSRSPYRLYALSNLGSMLALLIYPFFLEPTLARNTQARLWAWGLIGFAVCCSICAVKLWNVPAHEVRMGPAVPLGARRGMAPTTWHQAQWLLLPGCASVLLLAITNKLCMDIAVVPFLWVLPLALYLFSFVLCFDSPWLYSRLVFTPILISALGAVCWMLFRGVNMSIGPQVAVYSAALFVCCMVCHGELYLLKPEPDYLTRFYLSIAAGGMLGGIFVAVIAPVVFSDFFELHWGLLTCAFLFTLICVSEVRRMTADAQRDPWKWPATLLTVLAIGGVGWFLAAFSGDSAPPVQAGTAFAPYRSGGIAVMLLGVWVLRRRIQSFRGWPQLTCVWLGTGLVALMVVLGFHGCNEGDEVLYKGRNFYGVLTLYEQNRSEPSLHHLRLRHGRITHGLQLVDPAQARRPTAYYGERSGVGLAMEQVARPNRRIGLVGLGAGTLTAYARPGDSIRIYEINPAVTGLALAQFGFLTNCPARIELVEGDARLSLDREASQGFDLLVLDAFSGDAVPAHLLTKEAFIVYQKHLRTNGVMAFHISNRFLNLEPVVLSLASAFGYESAVIEHVPPATDWWVYPSTWALVTRDRQLLRGAPFREAARPPKTANARGEPWTDDFTSLFGILKWKMDRSDSNGSLRVPGS